MGPIFTPPTASVAEGPWGTLMLPSQAGGTNWAGGSLDPETGIIYLYTYTQVVSLGLINDPERSEMNFIRGRASEVGAREASLSIDGIPIIKPPWGRITAIDLNAGEIRWSIPFGEYPELTATGITGTGTDNYGGAIVTENGLLIIAATTYDNRIRAFDKLTGDLLWEAALPAAGNATPSTYMMDGRQYIVIAAGGGKNGAPSGGTYVAFALPE